LLVTGRIEKRMSKYQLVLEKVKKLWYNQKDEVIRWLIRIEY
jgi:hypothetical protein